MKAEKKAYPVEIWVTLAGEVHAAYWSNDGRQPAILEWFYLGHVRDHKAANLIGLHPNLVVREGAENADKDGRLDGITWPR